VLCKVMKCVRKYVFVLNSSELFTKTCAPNVHAREYADSGRSTAEKSNLAV